MLYNEMDKDDPWRMRTPESAEKAREIVMEEYMKKYLANEEHEQLAARVEKEWDASEKKLKLARERLEMATEHVQNFEWKENKAERDRIRQSPPDNVGGKSD
jgi:hypothetical protein